MEPSVAVALFLSFLAGAATWVGGLLAFIVKKDNFAALALGLGFSVYVSFMEMMPEAKTSLAGLYGENPAAWLSVGIFFFGVVLAWLIDRFMPSHHVHSDALEKKNKLKHLGLFTALALAVHNFPEGLATSWRCPFTTPRAAKAKRFGTAPFRAWPSRWGPYWDMSFFAAYSAKRLSV